MPFAARKGDPTIHGGMIVEGSPDTTIGGMPAARLLDKHVCPLHGPGPITETSLTVFINGVGAARMTDKCTCMVPSQGVGGGGGGGVSHATFKLGQTSEAGQKIAERTASEFDAKATGELSSQTAQNGSPSQQSAAFGKNAWSPGAGAGDAKNANRARARAGR